MFSNNRDIVPATILRGKLITIKFHSYLDWLNMLESFRTVEECIELPIFYSSNFAKVYENMASYKI